MDDMDKFEQELGFRCTSKENLLVQSALVMNATYIFFPLLIYKSME